VCVSSNEIVAESDLLRYDSALLGKWFQAFQREVLSSSSAVINFEPVETNETRS
jgi:hypothetical protein